MAGDSLKEDQIRLGLNEFEAITRLLLNKGVSLEDLCGKLFLTYTDVARKSIKHSALL